MKAFAKSNLILNLGQKNESGRFSIDFVMQEIDLFDTVEVTLKDGIDITIKADDPKVPCDENNLCYKAVAIIRHLADKTGGVHINLKKKIPSAGGLGGGSSDAASVMLQLLKLWKLDIPIDDVIKAANPILGTDTSFFLKGHTARVKDNGLSIKKIESDLTLHYVYILPEIEVPAEKTAAIYAYFDPEKITEKPNMKAMESALKKGDLEEIAKNLYNAFEYSLPPHYEKVLELKKELIEAGCLNAIMCGAGPTLFGLCESKETAEKIAKEFEGKHPLVFTAESRS